MQQHAPGPADSEGLAEHGGDVHRRSQHERRDEVHHGGNSERADEAGENRPGIGWVHSSPPLCRMGRIYWISANAGPAARAGRAGVSAAPLPGRSEQTETLRWAWRETAGATGANRPLTRLRRGHPHDIEHRY